LITENVEIVQRNDQSFSLQIKYIDGSVVPLDGYSLEYVVTSYMKEAMITKSDGNGINIIDAVNGQIEIILTNVDTDIPAELYKHELVLVDSNGRRYTALQGTFKIIDSIVD